MPPGRSQVTCSEINPSLGEGTGNNDPKHRRKVCMHLSIEDLAWVTLLDHLNEIFDQRGPEVSCTKNLLGCFQPRKMTATCSSVIVIQDNLCFFLSKTSSKNAIYTSTIQSVIKDEIVSRLVSYSLTLIMRRRSGVLQSLKIHKYISILWVQRCNQKNIFINW
jgi:hypothetical protein